MQFVYLVIGVLFTLVGGGLAVGFTAAGEFPIYVCLLPLIFVALGVFFLYKFISGKLLVKKLRENGRKVYAEITEVSTNYSVSINGRHPYLLLCEYNGARFQADYMKPVTYDLVGKTVPVYISEDDPSKYFVDLSEL
jgi:hypothetical protein